MNVAKALRQAAAHAERTPLIRFIGPRTIPSSFDHTPHPHPASPTGQLPESFAAHDKLSPKHTTFSAYRDHAQQHGPLQRTFQRLDAGIGGTSGSELGSILPPEGIAFDTSELPIRFQRRHIDLAEIEAIESGGAAVSA